ncbi:NADH-quinone oxidoreductase subunit NuoE [Ferrovibrio sp.]|jgi:NADH-quinone oxidoreductase subunit E|uniref:NADH-quinone oxidoreductase subunit NuoE n=1 Tax=Ferrovibrio sp. TaxID=1917215 RepID=UPI0035B4CE32
MSGVHIAPPELQPASFEFTSENMALAKKHIAKYPEGRQQSAVMPLLDIAQRQHNNWVPQAAIRYIADLLGMPAIRVLEVASFYTMYNLAPVGTHFVQVCTTTPCWLRGSDKVLSACKKHLGVGPGETTPDGKFTVIEVECLGACVNAPMLQLGDDFYEDLDEESTGKILEALKRGETPKPGPQNGRLSSEPQGGATTLTTFNPAASAGGNDD